MNDPNIYIFIHHQNDGTVNVVDLLKSLMTIAAIVF